MNIIFDINKFNIEYTHFLETKPNMILEGEFTKIIYSNPFFTLNGIYLYLPIEVQSIENQYVHKDRENREHINKNIIKFYPSSHINNPLILELSKIEYNIIDYYKQLNNITKKTVAILTRQLYSGSLKVYKETNDPTLTKNSVYIIKISGIWENESEIGITYKIIESFPVSL
jgi:hypothetical protein